MKPPPPYTVPLRPSYTIHLDDTNHLVLIMDFDTTSTYVFPHYSPAPPPNRTLTISLIVPLPTAPTVTHGTHLGFNGSLT